MSTIKVYPSSFFCRPLLFQETFWNGTKTQCNIYKMISERTYVFNIYRTLVFGFKERL